LNFTKPTPAFKYSLRFAHFSGATGHQTAFKPVKAGDQFTLEESWADGGLYLFLGEEIFDHDAFDAALTQHQQTHGGIRFLWLSNPNDDPANWNSVHLNCKNDSVAEDAQLLLRNHGLSVPKGAKIVPDFKKQAFSIQASSAQIQLLHRENQVNHQLPVLKSAPRIPMDRLETAGSLQYAVRLSTEQELHQMDIGLRFFMDKTGIPDALDSLQYPLFDVSQQPIDLFACLRPAAPDPSDSWYLFSDPDDPSPSPEIDGFFRTTLGHTIRLKPQPDAKLRFAGKPVDRTSVPTGYYLLPDGNFDLTVKTPPGMKAPHRLMCGFSGMEYFKAPPESGWILKFVTGKPAYAQNFSFDPTPQTPANGISWLDLQGLATTAWCYLLADGMLYYAQPDSAILHHRTGKDLFLSPLDAPIGRIPLYDEVNAPFTLAPYAGVSFSDFDRYRQFENQALYPSRKNFLQGIARNIKSAPASPHSKYLLRAAATPPSAPAYAAPVDAATPQGLLASISADLSRWQTLTLAKDKKGQVLRLTDINGNLKSAFQNNKLFLVASAPETLAAHFTDTVLDLANWTLDLSPDLWSANQTFIVFKFFDGKSFRELSGSTDSWTHADDFNRKVPETWAQLGGMLSQADKAGKTSDFGHFLETIDNPHWNGILAFNVHVPLSGLPPQIEGLAAGIDASRFKAHHMGIDLSPVQQAANGRVSIGSSALFGLINYQHTDPASPSGGQEYEFSVDSLDVLFVNAQVKDFSSSVRLTINSLFGEKATKQVNGADAPDNQLKLQGSYQQHDGHAAYTFTNTGQNCFKLDSAVLQSVTIEHAQFVTEVAAAPEKGQDVLTHFNFRGQLSFKAVSPMDLFSYDLLPFSNLTVDMHFNPADARVKQQFTFDPGRLTFNNAGVKARTGSFVAQFPLEARAFRCASTADLPAAFALVDLPEGFSKIDRGWFGLVFDLSLGSLGALAPKKETSAQWMLIWQPSATTEENPKLPLAAMIKLPFGEGGKDFFSIQGVIKMGMSGIALSQQDKSFIICFKNIALRLLMLSFPPGGSTNVYLFGDPDNKAKELAWYGAYVKDKTEEPKPALIKPR
jgi:hypothetical protein